LAFTFSGCSSDDGDGGGSGGGGSYDNCHIDISICDNIQDYKTVVIGEQTWMVENLNCPLECSRCYGDDSGGDSKGNCEIYGRLYSWATAMNLPSYCNSNSCGEQIQGILGSGHRGICPSGWRIPSHSDWQILRRFVYAITSSDSYTIGSKLKATSGWDSTYVGSGNGTDDVGFAALPGGIGFDISIGGGLYLGREAHWWVARETGSNDNYKGRAYAAILKYDSEVLSMPWEQPSKSSLRSIRCIKGEFDESIYDRLP
jgi:uncharacterized protein (TIGR02145 family)